MSKIIQYLAQWEIEVEEQVEVYSEEFEVGALTVQDFAALMTSYGGEGDEFFAAYEESGNNPEDGIKVSDYLDLSVVPDGFTFDYQDEGEDVYECIDFRVFGTEQFQIYDSSWTDPSSTDLSDYGLTFDAVVPSNSGLPLPIEETSSEQQGEEE